MNITKVVLDKYGFKAVCLGCRVCLAGRPGQRHSEECRRRLEKDVEDNPKLRRSKEREDEFLERILRHEEEKKETEHVQLGTEDVGMDTEGPTTDPQAPPDPICFVEYLSRCGFGLECNSCGRVELRDYERAGRRGAQARFRRRRAGGGSKMLLCQRSVQACHAEVDRQTSEVKKVRFRGSGWEVRPPGAWLADVEDMYVVAGAPQRESQMRMESAHASAGMTSGWRLRRPDARRELCAC